MGVTKQQAIENKQAIVTAAEQLFRERGVAAVGLTELTKAAGFTQGGFYNHFKSKDALVAAVMDKAMDDGAALFNAGVQASKTAEAVPIKRHVEWYLSPEHLANIQQGCPLTAYAGDVRRLGEQARQSYAHGLQWNIEQIAGLIEGDDEQQKRKQATALFAQLVGSLALSRAVAEADPALADEILEAGRQHLLLALER